MAFVARDWTAKLGLVAAGLGVTVVPGLAVPMLPSSVAVVAVDDPAAVRPTVLAHRPGHPCPGFVAALREAVVGLSAEVRRRLDAG
ncbi:LysR substrate binding domain protein [Actinomadura rubteroloni]|uniref:LysR substrate binding domain protein n=1 Tax=Actinomadura rubteroloni TaxID=1926885 RepID=A0A2P4ULW0_9ACTN|nr:LysR substrate binding domain protein [Actinomadura rubteroloni]